MNIFWKKAACLYKKHRLKNNEAYLSFLEVKRTKGGIIVTSAVHVYLGETCSYINL